MVFGKLLGAFGVGGPSVDTVLTNAHTRPGGVVNGQVNLTGGKNDAKIDRIVLSLVTRVEVESGEHEHAATVEFHQVQVAGGLVLPAGQQQAIPFSLSVPWEAPVTQVLHQHLRGMVVGVHTEVEIAGARDKSDLDAVHIEALPTQQSILDAFVNLGFGFKGADLEHGHIPGTGQTLPFYQEIEFYPAPQYSHAVNEVEVTFITDPRRVTVVLEFAKRGGMFSGGHDAITQFSVDHLAAPTDLRAVVEGWLQQAVSRHQSRGGYGYAQHGSHGSHHGGHGGGMGAAAGGLAVGLVGGYVAGEMLEDAFEDFGGDE
ncbi:sporulation-control protein [Allocatelliglobosispora scoriae]|uniref:Sporulation-control protein n=1 Tax=Allocatelliglobosispora scoriae TaxID=643052 RepID=A0A841BIF3_9ACTN|nr:sporulation protein [Allocatelliglobosispora scoriae]MBB5866949.1 sporulation-control protein [Allocatelliglobosispora scoriae]